MIYSSIIGRLGAEPIEDQTPKGKKFFTFNMASDSFENGQNVTEWVKVAVFDEALFKKTKSMKKGSQVSVHGKLKSRAYVTKDGTPRASIEIIANVLDFVGGHYGGTQASVDEKEDDPSKFDCGGKMEETKKSKPVPPKTTEAVEEVDDELPF